MLHHDPAQAKRDVFAALNRIARANQQDIEAAAGAVFAPDALWFGPHPLNELQGARTIAERAFRPIARSFRHLRRQDDLFFGGEFQGGDWIGATGHLHGVFAADFLDVPATGNWAWLRYGEFHKLEGGRIVRSHVIFDLPDLMRQAGVFPWRPGLGVETLTPGPATRDGVVLERQDPAESRKTLELVEAMIFQGLLEPEGGRSTVEQMRRYWTGDMLWYGPAMIGATMGIEAFYRFHEDPWEQAMQLRGPKPTREKKHVTRFGDGRFCGFTGWPSIYATHAGEFLGLPETGRPVEIRVMDFYRREGDLLAENWIFIDFPHLFLQLGIDLFDRMAALRDERRADRCASAEEGR